MSAANIISSTRKYRIPKRKKEIKMEGTNEPTIHAAIKARNFEAVHELLSRGIDVSQTDSFGNSPFHLATSLEDLQIFQNLCSTLGTIDVNAKNQEGVTVLHMAVQSNNTIAISNLLAHDADVNAKDVKGTTPLHIVAHFSEGDSHLEAAAMLLNKNADVNLQDVNGDTPLHILMRNNRVNGKIMQLFLSYEADFTIMNNFGEMPRNFFAILRYLFHKIKEINSEGWQYLNENMKKKDVEENERLRKLIEGIVPMVTSVLRELKGSNDENWLQFNEYQKRDFSEKQRWTNVILEILPKTTSYYTDIKESNIKIFKQLDEDQKNRHAESKETTVKIFKHVSLTNTFINDLKEEHTNNLMKLFANGEQILTEVETFKKENFTELSNFNRSQEERFHNYGGKLKTFYENISDTISSNSDKLKKEISINWVTLKEDQEKKFKEYKELLENQVSDISNLHSLNIADITKENATRVTYMENKLKDLKNMFEELDTKLSEIKEENEGIKLSTFELKELLITKSKNDMYYTSTIFILIEIFISYFIIIMIFWMFTKDI